MEKSDLDRLPAVSEKCEMVLYQPDDSIRLEVRLEGETVWLTRAQMAELFGRDVKTIGKHVNNALKEELNPELLKAKKSLTQVVAKFATTASDGKVYQVDHYSLDMILSVGYRVKSAQGVFFRAWANEILKQYITKGYAAHPSLAQVEYHLSKQIEGQREELFFLQQQVQRHQEQIDFLIERERPVTEQLFSTGCVWDAYTFVSDLVRSAKERLVLIDPFVDERTLRLLDKRADGVICTVHTRYSESVELDFRKHNQQCAAIGKVQLPHAVHDRYLIVDGQVWLLGASVKDMGRGLCTVIRLGFSPEDVLGRLK